MKRIVLLGLISPLYAIQTIKVPTDYQTVDAAIEAVSSAASSDGSTILLESGGPHKLTKALYDTPITLEANTLSHTGKYYGHLVGTFQTGPYRLSVQGTTITVEPATLEVPGKGTGNPVEFSEVVPGDKVLVYKHSGATEYEVVRAKGTTLTISEEVTFEPGEGFTIKPRTVVVAAQESVTLGNCSFKGISLEGTTHMSVDQGILEQCLCNWHIAASDITEVQVVHLGGVEITDTYKGKGQTFLGSGLTVFANKYAHSTQTCFIGSDKAIDAGTYAHMIAKDAEFYGCTTAIWADGGSHVAAPGSWIRSCNRGVRLSANSSCMTTDTLVMSDVSVGIRALFNSQFHATTLVLQDVGTHAEIDDQTLVELTPPFQPGVRTLEPDGYGAYHSGVSYNYLTSNTYSAAESYRHESSDHTTFLDSIPTEVMTEPYRTKKFVMPVQRRAGEPKKEGKKEKRCSRNCGKAPCNPCCKKKCRPCKPRCRK